MIKLTREQLEAKTDFIESYISAKNAADGSKMDANANVTTKSLATMEAEINKDINIQINRHKIQNQLEKMYGKELSDEYIRQLKTHEIYTNDESSIKTYCASITMYPFLLEGMVPLGGEAKAPKHLRSFCGNFTNLVYAVSAQLAGAVATVEFLMYFNYFAKKDYGVDYLTAEEEIIKQSFQEVVYNINQPAAARGLQSCFWNISLFDKFYFESMFGNFVFPDGVGGDWEGVEKLQRYFMKWFNKERETAVLTFPVVTAALLHDNEKPLDEDFHDFLAEELSEGNAFFTYSSDSADSLSSCCFDGSQKTLTLEYGLTEFNKLPTSEPLQIFHKGELKKGKMVKIPRGSKKMYSVELMNDVEVIVTEDHKHVTMNGDKLTSELAMNDRLQFNTSPNTVSINDILDEKTISPLLPLHPE